MPKKQKFPYLVGSKWTALEDTFGWRHFIVTNRKNENSLIFAELKATCDQSVRFWLNAKSLKDPNLWQPGWMALNEQSSELSSFTDNVTDAKYSVSI